MAKAKPKFYVVWSGTNPGVYLTWEECKAQVIGVEGSRYKSFDTMEEARKAFAAGPEPIVRGKKKADAAPANSSNRTPSPIQRGLGAGQAIAVDAACSGNPGMMEYQGVDVVTKARIFHFGPIYGTNNIGEFLAIVHALALQKKQGTRWPIYSDSRNAQLWVKAKKCKTKLEMNDKTAGAHDMIRRAEHWLQNNNYDDIQILKWQTDEWGEIPADFGRK